LEKCILQLENISDNVMQKLHIEYPLVVNKV
jgi:hypothetical protein